MNDYVDVCILVKRSMWLAEFQFKTCDWKFCEIIFMYLQFDYYTW